MKIPALTLALLAALAVAASAQEPDGLPRSLAVDASPSLALAAPELPASLTADAPQAEPKPSPFSIGLAGGYLVVKDADRGTWFGGAQARLRFGLFAVEASITAHQNEYEDGDVVVTQYPVQLTAFLYPIPEGPFRPYILGGVGWYYTRVDYQGLFAALDDHTEHIFGEHFGAGLELLIAPRVSIDADVRYIFLNPSNDQVIHRDFNYWQVTLGLNFFL